MDAPRDYNQLFEQVKLRIIPFLAVFFGIVFFSYLLLSAIDLVPEPISDDNESDRTEESLSGNALEVRGSNTELERVPSSNSNASDPTPERLIIDDLDRDVAILNPTSNTVEALDAALLKGVVRHPDSADFSDVGNILVIGHSSYLPNVFNKNFQALNGIQNLTWGDLVRLQSADTEYVYRVEKVYQAKATELIVPNDRGEARLTLATCNTFGAKEDRFIVEAVLVEEITL